MGSAVNDTTRELGGTLGVAVVGSVFSSLYGPKLLELLAGLPIPAAALDAAEGSVQAAVAVADMAPPAGRDIILDATRTAFLDGFSGGVRIAAAAAAIGSISAMIFLPARGTNVDAERGPHPAARHRTRRRHRTGARTPGGDDTAPGGDDTAPGGEDAGPGDPQEVHAHERSDGRVRAGHRSDGDRRRPLHRRAGRGLGHPRQRQRRLPARHRRTSPVCSDRPTGPDHRHRPLPLPRSSRPGHHRHLGRAGRTPLRHCERDAHERRRQAGHHRARHLRRPGRAGPRDDVPGRRRAAGSAAARRTACR